MDLRSLALFRIALGGLTLYDLICRIPDWDAFYTNSGVLSRVLYENRLINPWRISPYLWTDSPVIAMALACLTVAAACALMTGYKTRISCIVTWLLLMSLQVRNPMVNTNGDHLLRLLLLAGIFLPLGRRYSIDRIKCPGLNQGRTDWWCGWSASLYWVQFFCVYAFAAAFKLMDRDWSGGQALHLILNNPNVVTPVGALLLKWPPILHPLNYGVICIEFAAPLLLLFGWRRIRLPVIGLLAVFHISLGLCLYLGFFSWVSVAALIPFLPNQCWGPDRSAKTHGSSQTDPNAVTDRRSGGPVSRWLAHTGIFLALLVAGANLESLVPRIFKLPTPLREISRVFYVDQTWSVFSPPGDFFIWYEIPAKLQSGLVVDLSPFPRPNPSPHRFVLDYFDAGFRWKRYLTKVWSTRFYFSHPAVLRYLVSKWERSNPRMEDRVVEAEIFKLYQRSGSDPQPPQRARTCRF